jgi:flagellar export protein FliJ
VKRAFQFRLARVARAREIFEEEARAHLAVAQGAANQARAHVAALEAAIQTGHATQATIQAQPGAPLDVRALLSRDQSLVSLQTALARARQLAAAADRVADEKRAAWQLRRQDCHALEELRKRDFERHLNGLQRVENAEMDEVAGRRFQFMANPDFRESGD